MKAPAPLADVLDQPLSRLSPALARVRDAVIAAPGVQALADGDASKSVTTGHSEDRWLRTLQGKASPGDLLERPCRVFVGHVPNEAVEVFPSDAYRGCPEESLKVQVHVRRYFRPVDSQQKGATFLAFLHCLSSVPYDVVAHLTQTDGGADVTRCVMSHAGHSDPEQGAGQLEFAAGYLMVEFSSVEES